MIPKTNRKVTAEEALEQCRRNREEARIPKNNRDRPYVIDAPSPPSRDSAPASTAAKSKAS